MAELPELRVFTDYHCFPLWRPGGDPYNVDPRGLVSDALAADLEAWQAQMDATYDDEVGQDSGFATTAAWAAFADRGRPLAVRVAAELTGRFHVVYAEFDRDERLS